MSHEFKSDLLLPAATTSVPSLNVPHGTAPSSPANGDIWTTSTGIYARINGTTNQLDAAGGAHDHDADYVSLTGDTMSGDLIISEAASNVFIGLRAANTYSSGLALSTGASDRWSFQKTNEAESTGDAGSNFGILAFNDSGGYIDAPFTIKRVASGDMILSRPVWVNASISTEEAFRIKITDAHTANAFRVFNASFTDYLTIDNQGKLNLEVSSTTRAPLNITPGSAPTTPVNGDLWSTTGGMYIHADDTTHQLNTFDVGYDGVITDTNADVRWFGTDVPLGTSIGTSTVGTGDTAIDIVAGTNVKVQGGIKSSYIDPDPSQLKYIISPDWTEIAVIMDFIYEEHDVSKTIFELQNTSVQPITSIRLTGSSGNLGSIRIYEDVSTSRQESSVVMFQPGKWYTLGVVCQMGVPTSTEARVTTYLDGTQIGTVDITIASGETIARARFGASSVNGGDDYDLYLRNIAFANSTTLPTSPIKLAEEYHLHHSFDADAFPVSVDNLNASTDGFVVNRTVTSASTDADIFKVKHLNADALIVDSLGKTTVQAATTSTASLNIPNGTAPTSPVNGDIWTTTAGAYVRINGSTFQSGMYIGSTAPSSPVTGMLWLDTT